MAIKIKREDGYVYLGVSGFLGEELKGRADEIYRVSESGLRRLDERLKRVADIDHLEAWHLKGKLINEIIGKFNITDVEKRYFWLMLYNVMGLNVPQRAKAFHIQNDFRVASILATYPLSNLQRVGSWGLWREIIGSTKIGDDDRVARWVADYILRHGMTRDGSRPFLRLVRNRLKNLDTKILSDRELVNKLREVEKK